MSTCIAVTGIPPQFVLCDINSKTRSRVSHLTFWTEDVCVLGHKNKILGNFLHFCSYSSQMGGVSEQPYQMLLMLILVNWDVSWTCHPCHLHGERCTSSTILVMTAPASIGGRKVKLFSTVYVEGVTIWDYLCHLLAMHIIFCCFPCFFLFSFIVMWISVCSSLCASPCICDESKLRLWGEERKRNNRWDG